MAARGAEKYTCEDVEKNPQIVQAFFSYFFLLHSSTMGKK